MSFRTLKFGDRTISYDTGLNLVDASGRGKKSDLKIMTQTAIYHNDNDNISNRSNRRIIFFWWNESIVWFIKLP